MSDRDKGVRLATYVSREVDARLREYARRERRSVSGYAALLIERGLDEDYQKRLVAADERRKQEQAWEVRP